MTIARLIDKEELRKSLIHNAQEHLFENFESEAVLKRFVENIPELESYKTNNKKIRFLSWHLCTIRVRYVLFRMRGWYGTAYTMLRNGNIKALWGRIQKRVKKMAK